MLHIYVWDARSGAWGHCSMYVHRAEPERSRYISWWPGNPSDVNLIEANVGVARNWGYDCRAEGKTPDHEFVMNPRGRSEELNEERIVQVWDEVKQNPVYHPDSWNCCTVVVRLLRAGGADRWQRPGLSDNDPIFVWTPAEVVDYVWRSLTRRFFVYAPLRLTAPPEITRAHVGQDFGERGEALSRVERQRGDGDFSQTGLRTRPPGARPVYRA